MGKWKKVKGNGDGHDIRNVELDNTFYKIVNDPVEESQNCFAFAA